MNFLEGIANYLYGNYALLEDSCLIFPNKRSGLYFSNCLSKLIDRPIWMPECRAMRDWIQVLSNCQIDNNLSLLFTLYNLYIKHTGDKTTFDDFYGWGELILSDFSNIDKYLVNAHDIFTNISDLNNIRYEYLTQEQKDLIASFWKSFDGKQNQPIRTSFKDIWSKLPLIYDDLNVIMNNNSKGYEGFVYRKCIDSVNLNTNVNKYIFIGLNALNTCETKLLQTLKNNNKALFFWDYDDYYTQDNPFEAGLFMRKNIKMFPMPSDFEFEHNNLSTRHRVINVHSVPSDSEQSRVMFDILRTKELSNDPIKTAIILPDEQLLLPVLNNIPENIDEINISMGYPWASSPAGSLLEKLITLNKTASTTNDNTKFRLLETIDVLLHPYLCNVVHIKQSDLKLTQSYICDQDIAPYISNNYEQEVVKTILSPCKTYLDFINWLKDICRICLNGFDDNEIDNGYHKEYLYAMLSRLIIIADIFSSNNVPMDLNTAQRIIQTDLRTLRIPFKGEPLKGTQIIGLLETRCIDFENVIIMSMNEGSFPKKSIDNSYIPYSLRKAFNLPTYEHQDAIYAYYFYRILQRASNIDLIYSSAPAKNSIVEKSRYIYQLEFESIFKLEDEQIHTFNISLPNRNTEVFAHNDETYKNLLKRRISPSAVSTFVNCRLEFWYKYIKNLKDINKPTDSADAAFFGTLLHTTSQFMYEPLIKKVVNASYLTSIDKTHINQLIQKAFNYNYLGDRNIDYEIKGKDLIISYIIARYMSSIIDLDINYAPFTIYDLEYKVSGYRRVTINNQAVKINFGGLIDRLDVKDGYYRIIDYKTGDVEQTFNKDLLELFGLSTNKALLQTLLYSFILHQSGINDDKIVPSLYPIKNISAQNFDYHFKSGKNILNSYSEIREDFEANLDMFLAEQMFNPNTIFEATEKSDNCKYCSFKLLCNKQ